MKNTRYTSQSTTSSRSPLKHQGYAALGICLSFVVGCSYLGDKIGKGTSAKASSRFAASKSLSVPASEAHLSPQHLNMFLLDELPSPTQRINYQIEVARSLYAGGQKERSRQVMAHAWRTAGHIVDTWDSDSENVQNFISGAFYTGNKSILRKCEVLDGGLLSEMLEDYVGPHAQAINLVLDGKTKEGQTALVECVANGSGPEGAPYGDLDYVIRSLNQSGRKGAAKALLAPYYWHWFPPKKKAQETGGVRGKERGTVQVNLQEAAAVSPLQDIGPFIDVSGFCRFIETYSLVHGARKAEPLVKKALELAATIKSEELGQVAPSHQLKKGLRADTIRTYHVLQEAASGAEAVAGSADLDLIHLSRLLASAGHDAEARRLADILSSYVQSAKKDDPEEYYEQVELLTGLAEAYQRFGDKDKAVSALDEAAELYLAMDIVDHMGLSRIAVLYARLGEEQKAMETFNKCLRSFSSIKNQASGLAMAASVEINSGELSRELRDLSASLRVKLADKNKDALQYIIFDVLGESFGGGEAQPLYEVNGYLMEMAGWLSCDNYYDDWVYRGSFSRIEQSMARELVRVVMGGEPAVKKQANLDDLFGKGTAAKSLPPWLSSVSPDAGVLFTYDISSIFELFESIPDETLQEMVLTDPSIPEWAAPLVVGPAIKFLKGARLDQKGQSALESVLEFVPDKYKAEAQLAVDFLGGNVGLSDHPMGFWMELLPAKEDENASASEREVLLIGAIPIKGGDRITEWLGKSPALREAGIILTEWGKYKVIESTQLAELGDLLDVPIEGVENIPYVMGIKENQIVVLGMAQLKLEVGLEGGPLLTEFKGGMETVKAHFWRKFSNPKAKEYDIAPRFKQLLSKPAMVNGYFSIFEFMEMLLSAWEDQPLEDSQLEMLRQGRVQLQESDAEDAGLAYSFSFNVAPEGFMVDLKAYNNRKPKSVVKSLPRELGRLLGDFSSAVGTYSLDVDEIQKQIMEQHLFKANLQMPSDEKLDLETFKEKLGEEFERENGIKLSAILDSIPESILFVGPDMNQRLSEIGASTPGLVLGVKLRNKDHKISQLFDLIEKQGGLPEEIDIEELLFRVGFHVIEKNGYIYLCSGEYKSAIEQGHSIGRKSTRPDVERIIKGHGASMVIDGELLSGIGRMGGFAQLFSGVRQVGDLMAIIDKMYVAAGEGKNGESVFRMGASFKPGGWNRIVKTMAAQALAGADDKSKFTLLPWRTDTIQRRYDKPVSEVMAAVRSAVSSMGTLTSEKKVPEGEMMKNIITGRIDTRHVWVTVRPDKQAPETVSAVSFQVRTDSSFLVGGRNPDLQMAAALAEQTTLALIAAANPLPGANNGRQKSVGLTAIPAMKPIVKTVTVSGPTQPLGGGNPLPGGNPGGAVTDPTIVEIPQDPLNQALGKNFSGNDIEDRDTFLAQMVHFDENSSSVRPSDLKKVEIVAQHLIQNTTHKLMIEGHSDERGTEGHNVSLGERRALAVADELLRLGISQGRIRTTSYGEKIPMADGLTEQAFSQNRRSEFVLLKPGN